MGLQMIYFQYCEKDKTKMAFSHFKQGRYEPINFALVKCNDTDLQKSWFVSP
jgi:hypothetical protein